MTDDSLELSITKDCTNPFKGPMLSRINFSKKTFFLNSFNYALECFLETDGAPIRFTIIFCFDLDVQKIIQLFQKIFFSIDPKIFDFFWFFSRFFFKFWEKKLFEHLEDFFSKFCFFSKFRKKWKNPQKFQKILDRSKKIFLKELRKNFEHQYRSKISLRIEWEHSQPLKITLKHSNLHPMKLYQ